MKKLAIVSGLVLVGTGALWASITAPLPIPQTLRFVTGIVRPIQVAPVPEMPNAGLDAMIRVHAFVAAQA